MRASDVAKAGLPALAVHAAAAGNSGRFSIYAYGPGVGGLPLFSSGVTVGDGGWKGSPNTTGYAQYKHPNWFNKTLVVPGPSSSSRTVRMINDTVDTSDYVSSIMLYGSFVMIEEGGEMFSLWYGQLSDTEGVYTIGWNTSSAGESGGKVPLALKKTPPSSPTHE
ncbi:hypothetical protein ACLX1H_003094 [Fusarium chlamydosporum]